MKLPAHHESSLLHNLTKLTDFAKYLILLPTLVSGEGPFVVQFSQEGPPVLELSVQTLAVCPMRDRGPCSPLASPPPSSKPDSPTRGRDRRERHNKKFGGLDMLQPVATSVKVSVLCSQKEVATIHVSMRTRLKHASVQCWLL